MYIYLLVSKNNHMFKIGRTTDPKTRIKSLNKDFDFDFEKSRLVHCVDYAASVRLEKTLHQKFRNYNIRYLPIYDGSTEFFDINCFDSVLTFFITPYDYIDEISHLEEIFLIENLPNKTLNSFT